MPYRTTQYVILRLSVWHYFKMSYRFPHIVWLNQTISYLHFTSSSPLYSRTDIVLARFFSSFCYKLAGYCYFKPKACWLLCLIKVSSRIAAEIFEKPKPWSTELDRVPRVRAILTDSWPVLWSFDRVLALQIILWWILWTDFKTLDFGFRI